MFPIPANHQLTFAKVANHWAREVRPQVAPAELLNELITAWWRGDLIASGTKRADVLRGIFNSRPNLVAFAFPDSPDPPQTDQLQDGSVDVLWLWLVPLPNTRPETWDDDNCVYAFQAVAKAWDAKPNTFELWFPGLMALELTEPEFSRWINSQGKPTPTFWARGDERANVRISRPRLTYNDAISMALEFVRSARCESRQSTLQGFEKKIRDAGLVADRDAVIRPAYREAARRLAVEVKRGRPRKAK